MSYFIVMLTYANSILFYYTILSLLRPSLINWIGFCLKSLRWLEQQNKTNKKQVSKLLKSMTN